MSIETQQLHPFFSGTMPLPPSINASYKPRAKRDSDESAFAGTPELIQFKHDANFMLADQHTSVFDWGIINAIRDSKKRKTPLAVILKFYFSTEWKSDLDDRIKAAIDAAFAKLELDDRLVIRIEAEKLVDPINPRTEIEIRCIAR